MGRSALFVAAALGLMTAACTPLREAMSVPDQAPAARQEDTVVDSQSADMLVADAPSLDALLSVHPDDLVPQAIETDTAAPAGESAADDTGPAKAIPKYPDDLWARIRDGFELPTKDAAIVEVERDYFANHPGYLERVADRARPYLYHIVKEVDANDMPMEIALLPIVESAFQPFAYSPGRAAGIWQFIPGTGRHFGLKQTWWYDGRRDIFASTDAALDYLARLHDYFGDWLLALAAYNSGEGTVQRAVRYNKRRGRPTDFWHLNLPRETRSYVPRLLAISSIVADPDKYGVDLTTIPDKPYLAQVNVGSQIDLALAAQLAKLPIEELYRLNPGFNRWATDPDGPYKLALPLSHVDAFKNALADVPANQRVTWRRHRVRSGETLGGIARRFHTTVDVLRNTNKLRGHMIRAGHYLLVPTASQPVEDYALSQSQRKVALQNKSHDGQKVKLTVRRGDTLWDLHREYDVSVGQIARWNGMSPRDPLKPGQTLVLWVDGDVAQLAPRPPSMPPVIKSIRYTVRGGDSLYRIAQRFNVSIRDLQRWNDIDTDSYLQPGQRLTLHVDVRAQSGNI